MVEKTNEVKKLDDSVVIESLKEENTQLKAQLESVIKRYKKLTELYNVAIEKFLSE